MSDQTSQSDSTSPASGGLGGTSSVGMSRRGMLRAAGAGAAVLGGGGLLDACSSGIKGASASTSTSTGSSTKDISIAFIHPLTGDLADFGTSDNWLLGKIQGTSQYKAGIKTGGKTYKISITSYDTQSDATRAGQLTRPTRWT
jgi:ABC-type branched-subunit amino acid transport system substrate-binding protein